jgi:hypothetical protein
VEVDVPQITLELKEKVLDLVSDILYINLAEKYGEDYAELEAVSKYLEFDISKW